MRWYTIVYLKWLYNYVANPTPTGYVGAIAIAEIDNGYFIHANLLVTCVLRRFVNDFICRIKQLQI